MERDKYIRLGAYISSDGVYRYKLWRMWGEGPICLFIMLNPSTANGTDDDPTIRRCVAFAKAQGYGGIVVCNLFAFRASSPKVLLELKDVDPVGWMNQKFVTEAVQEAGKIVLAWGANGCHMAQDKTMLGWLDIATDKPLYCLGKTFAGFPRHPLYVPGAQKFERFE